MTILRVFIAGCCAAAAFSLATALATRDGVGVAEYVTGILLVALLAVAAVRMARRALRRTA